MKSKKYMQMVWIEEESGKRLAERVNEVMEEQGERSPALSLHLDKGFCAVVTYEVREEIPETEEEKAHARGLYLTCGQCPHFRKADDKRVRWGECSRGGRTKESMPACEYRYEEKAKEVDCAGFRNLPELPLAI